MRRNRYDTQENATEPSHNTRNKRESLESAQQVHSDLPGVESR